MQWWAWIAVGAVLLGSELTFVNAQFYLVFVGASALMVGILALAGAATADWLQWLIFAALAVDFLARVPAADLRAHAPHAAGHAERSGR